MDLRGQRFTLDLSDDEGESPSQSNIHAHAVPPIQTAFIGDIKEREVGVPTAPKLKPTANGFPEHKKRTRVSAFKQQRAGTAQASLSDSGNAYSLPPRAGNSQQHNAPAEARTEKEKIDLENKQRMAAMTPREIEEERQELLESLDPALLERFLRRANLDEGRGDTGIDLPVEKVANTSDEATTLKREPQRGADIAADNSQDKLGKVDHEAVPVPTPTGKPVKPQKTVKFADDDDEPSNPIDLHLASEAPSFDPSTLPEGSIHFPQSDPIPDLDPSAPDFLENLHKKYFPSLPADPTKLAWMAPLPTPGSLADQDSSYYPGQTSISASSLRFDFRGGLLPPRIARAMPSSRGLHHHADAPEAAGYTVAELSTLARSVYPAQRCIAFQTLGRLLYRLGRGEWGGSESEITQGLWAAITAGKALETLQEAAAAEGGHRGSQVYATEAVWLWQKGGGKPVKAQ